MFRVLIYLPPSSFLLAYPLGGFLHIRRYCVAVRSKADWVDLPDPRSSRALFPRLGVRTVRGDENRAQESRGAQEAALAARAGHVRALVAPRQKARADDVRERDLL